MGTPPNQAKPSQHTTNTTNTATTTTEFRRNYFTSPILKDKVKENALGSALAKVRGFNSDKYGLRRFVNLKNFATSIENAERVYDVKNVNNHFRGNYSTRPQKKKGFETLKPFKHRKTTLRKTMTMPKPMPAPAYTVSQYLDRSKENASSPQSRNRNENR